MFAFSLLVSALYASAALAAPLTRRQNPCFVRGDIALPGEIQDLLPTLGAAVTCNDGPGVFPGVPDVTSGGVTFSSVDFRNSDQSTLGFSLSEFAIPDDPATADRELLQNQLNVYLAVEAGLRSQPDSKTDVGQVKVPKFFLQFQMARVRTALGESLGVAETVEHQLGKVVKNAGRVPQEEIDEVNALATQI